MKNLARNTGGFPESSVLLKESDLAWKHVLFPEKGVVDGLQLMELNITDKGAEQCTVYWQSHMSLFLLGVTKCRHDM